MLTENTRQQCDTNIPQDSFKKFGIETNATALKIWMDTLYSNKIPTIVRELTSNARDSHQVAGTLDIPIEIHRPDSVIERTFYVRDYGTGLSEEEVLNIYSVFFKSTKNQDNDQIGGFGLGSKTPLAYSDQFYVTSFYNGKKIQYMVFKDEVGYPTLAKVGIESTDEPNGLKVEFAVNEKDVFAFEDAICSFVRSSHNFNIKILNIPKDVLTGRYGDFGYKEIGNIPEMNIQILKRTFPKSNRGVLLGGIYYNLNDRIFGYRRREEQIMIFNSNDPLPYDEVEKELGVKFSPVMKEEIKFYDTLFNSNISENFVLEFPIGSLEVTASRESLSFSKKTSEAIRNAYMLFVNQIFTEYEKFKQDGSWIIPVETFEDYVENLEKFNIITRFGAVYSFKYLGDFFKPTNTSSVAFSTNGLRKILVDDKGQFLTSIRVLKYSRNDAKLRLLGPNVGDSFCGNYWVDLTWIKKSTIQDYHPIKIFITKTNNNLSRFDFSEFVSFDKDSKSWDGPAYYFLQTGEENNEKVWEILNKNFKDSKLVQLIDADLYDKKPEKRASERSSFMEKFTRREHRSVKNYGYYEYSYMYLDLLNPILYIPYTVQAKYMSFLSRSIKNGYLDNCLDLLGITDKNSFLENKVNVWSLGEGDVNGLKKAGYKLINLNIFKEFGPTNEAAKEIFKKLRANFYLKLFQYLDGPITSRPSLCGYVLVENTSSDPYCSVRYELDSIENHFYRVARLVVSRRRKIDFQKEIQKLPLDTALDYLLQNNIEFTNNKGNVQCFNINKRYLLNKIKEKLGQIQLNEQLGNLNGLDLLVE